MSTYTDLHNRVKESLTVDYHSRITPQVISALNPENEFWGKFRGSFVGDVQISSLSDSVIFDSDFVRGRTLSSTMDSPKLFLSVDEESGEDVVQDLTAYIAEHGSGGISPADLSALEVSVVSAEPETGYSAKYIVTQGGVQAGEPIQVPADKVIEAAGVVDYNGTDAKIRIGGNEYDVKGGHPAGKYIVMVTAVSEDQLWILVRDLVDVYTAGEGLVLSGGEFSVSSSVLADIKAHSGRLSVLSTYAETRSQLSNDGYLTFGSFSSAQTSALDSGITAGLVHDYSAHIADDDIHVTSADKESWNGKYDKPLSGIPKTDLDADVRESLGKADTALQKHQSLSGYATEEWVKGQGYLSSHQSLSGYATEEWVRSEVSTEAERAIAIENGLDGRLNEISGKIVPAAPSTSAGDTQLAGAKSTADFVNSSINNFAAFYITKTATGDAFQTKAELTFASVFYNAGIERTPTKNDYCIVLSDESRQQPGKVSAPTTRYSWQGEAYPDGQWEFQYELNNTTFTQAQIAAIDSGVTSETVTQVAETASRVGGLAKVSADHDRRILGLEAGAMMLSGGEFTGGVSFKKGEADLSACFSGVVDSDDHALSDFLDPLPESVTVFGVCVRINDMIRFSGKGVDPVPYDTTDIEDVFGTVKELTGVEPTDIWSVRAALNGALAALTLGPAGRTLEGRLGILSERDDSIIERVDALSAEVAKGSALAEVSAFLSGEIDKKADSSELTAYALSANVMSRETAAGRFDGVNGRIDDVLAKLKGVYSALSGLPSNPAEFNLIENVAPALIALRSALSAFA